MTAREPGPVTCLDDLSVRFSTAAVPAAVEVVDTRTGVVLLALPAEQAATLAGSLGYAAGRLRTGLAEIHAGQS